MYGHQVVPGPRQKELRPTSGQGCRAGSVLAVLCRRPVTIEHVLVAGTHNTSRRLPSTLPCWSLSGGCRLDGGAQSAPLGLDIVAASKHVFPRTTSFPMKIKRQINE